MKNFVPFILLLTMVSACSSDDLSTIETDLMLELGIKFDCSEPGDLMTAGGSTMQFVMCVGEDSTNRIFHIVDGKVKL